MKTRYRIPAFIGPIFSYILRLIYLKHSFLRHIQKNNHNKPLTDAQRDIHGQKIKPIATRLNEETSRKKEHKSIYLIG